MSITKRELAELVRTVQAHPEGALEIESLLESLSNDLAYIEALARLVDEKALQELEAKGEETLW